MESARELARSKRILDSIITHLNGSRSMGLAEAVLEVVEEMKDVVGTLTEASIDSHIYQWIALLKIAVKSSGEGKSKPPTLPDTNLDWDAIAKREETKKLEREREEQARKASFQEGYAPSIIECVGGSHEGLMVPWDGKAPIGAKTNIGGEVYEYRDGKLHFLAKS